MFEIKFIVIDLSLIVVGCLVGVFLAWGRPVSSIWFFNFRYGRNFYLAGEPLHCWRNTKKKDSYLIHLRMRDGGHPWPWPICLIVDEVDMPDGYRGEVFVGRDATGKVFVQKGTFEY